MNNFQDALRVSTLVIFLFTSAGALQAVEIRAIDGSGSHLTNADQGQAFKPLVRTRDVIANPLPNFDAAKIAPAYEDGIDMPRGTLNLDTPPGVGTSNATLSNEFANAACRVGHTLLSSQIQLVDAAGNSQGSEALRDDFFDSTFAQENDVDVLLKGLSMQQAQDVDAFVVDEIRDFLLDEGNGELDLPAVNIQCERDHGLPSYNDMRRGLGLEPHTSFLDIASDPHWISPATHK